jgi:hypothetical protein
VLRAALGDPKHALRTTAWEATRMTRSSAISIIARAGANTFWDTGSDPRPGEHLKESKIKG